MQRFKPSDEHLEGLRLMAVMLREGNAAVAKANKDIETAKQWISRWLKTERGVDLDALEVGEVLSIEEVALIEIASQNRFDAVALAAAEPELHKKFKREFAVKKWRPLA